LKHGDLADQDTEHVHAIVVSIIKVQAVDFIITSQLPRLPDVNILFVQQGMVLVADLNVRDASVVQVMLLDLI
jgi:hypothetical protein